LTGEGLINHLGTSRLSAMVQGESTCTAPPGVALTPVFFAATSAFTVEDLPTLG
jgi:hypothetical protein